MRSSTPGWIVVIICVAVAVVVGQWGSQPTSRVIAPEISATQTNRSTGVLGFAQKDAKSRKESVQIGNYVVSVSDPTFSDEYSAGTPTYLVTYTLTWKPVAGSSLDSVAIGMQSTTPLTLTTLSGKRYSPKESNGFPTRQVTYQVEDQSDLYTLEYHDEAQKKQGQSPVVWLATR